MLKSLFKKLVSATLLAVTLFLPEMALACCHRDSDCFLGFNCYAVGLCREIGGGKCLWGDGIAIEGQRLSLQTVEQVRQADALEKNDVIADSERSIQSIVDGVAEDCRPQSQATSK